MARDLIPVLEASGYEHVPEFKEKAPDVVYFVRGARARRSEHLYVVAHDGQAWRRYLSFRDRLCSDEAVRHAYQLLKQTLAEAYPRERPKYTAAKAAFIESTLES